MRTINLFELYAKIGLDTKDFENGIENASKQTTSFGNKLKNGLATAAKVGAAALAAVTTATTAISAAMIKGVSNVASYGDNVDKMSQKMGLSAEAYQEWDAIMQHSGTSIESLQASMKTLANAVENGNDAFERLGISQEEIAKMSNEELFSTTISALQNVENETERTYLAGQLLGRGATELGALLNTSAEDTEAMRQRVHELGGVMSNEAVKAAAAYQDSLQDMKTAMSGVSRGILSEFLPSITSIMDGLTEIFAGNGDKGIGQIKSGIDDLIDNISAAVPKFLEIGSNIVSSISGAIAKNLPSLMSMVLDIIQTLLVTIADTISEQSAYLIQTGLDMLLLILQGVTDNIDTLADGAISIVEELATWIGEYNYVIADAITGLITKIAEVLSNPDYLSSLIDSGLYLVQAILDGIMRALPTLIDSIPTIIDNIVQAIVLSFQTISAYGPVIINSIIEIFSGLVDQIPAIIEKIAEALPVLIQALVEFWDEHGQEISDTLTNLIHIIAENLPNIINQLVTLITENAGQLLELAVTIISELINALLEALTKDETVKALADMATDIIQALTDGLLAAIPVIVDALPELIDGIVEAIVAGIPILLDGAVQFFTAIIDALPEIIDKLLEALPEIIDTVVKGLSKGIKDVLKAATKLFNAIIEALPDIIDALVENLPDIITTIIDTLVEAIPDLLDAAIEFLMAIIDAIPEIIPDLIEKLPDIINTILKALIDAIPDVLEAAGKMLRSIFTAIGNLVKELPGMLGKILKSLVDTITGWIPELLDLGGKLIEGLWEGIKGAFKWVTEGIGNLFGGVVDGVKGLLGIHSPSRVFAEIGKNMALGVGEGWEKTFGKVSEDIENGLDFTGDLAYNTYGNTDINGNGMNGNIRGINVTQNIYSSAKTAADLMEEARWNFDMAVAY